MPEQQKSVDELDKSTGDKDVVTLPKKEYDRLISQLRRQKDLNDKLSQDLSALRRKQNSKPETKCQILDDDRQLALVATRVIRNDVGDVGYDQKVRKIHESMVPLMQFVRPLINVAQAAVLSQDVFKRTPMMEKDENGKLTDRPVELDGKRQFMPSRLDTALAYLEFIRKLPEYGPLATALQKVIQTPEFADTIKKVAKAVASSSEPYTSPFKP